MLDSQLQRKVNDSEVTYKLDFCPDRNSGSYAITHCVIGGGGFGGGGGGVVSGPPPV